MREGVGFTIVLLLPTFFLWSQCHWSSSCYVYVVLGSTDLMLPSRLMSVSCQTNTYLPLANRTWKLYTPLYSNWTVVVCSIPRGMRVAESLEVVWEWRVYIYRSVSYVDHSFLTLSIFLVLWRAWLALMKHPLALFTVHLVVLERLELGEKEDHMVRRQCTTHHYELYSCCCCWL